jgi:hypothetical protein
MKICDIGTYVTLFDEAKFIILAEQIDNSNAGKIR